MNPLRSHNFIGGPRKGCEGGCGVPLGDLGGPWVTLGPIGCHWVAWEGSWVTLGVPRVPLGDLGGLLGGPWVTLGPIG